MPDLPSGTVTFLLTDIEGSTKLWEQYPNDMKAALARHDDLLTRGIEQHDGIVVVNRGEGDSFFAVFNWATNAVAAACSIQQVLLSQLWSTPSLQVRMALHTGEAELRNNDYYGLAINRCARLRAIAHGGQILLSHATAELVLDSLPDGVSLQELGAHGLKDLQRPEEVYQVLHPALPSEFPPLNSLVARLHDLPMPCPYQGLRAFQPQHASYFFGREGFTGQLVQAVQEQPLTAVVGPSGSGKSSVVFAGLLPRLHREGNWVIISCRPGREPFQELAASLIPFLEPHMSETDQLIERNKLARALRSGEVHLHEIVKRILGKQPEASRHLLVCDQFEELYTLSQDAEECTCYLNELLQAVAVLSQHQAPQFSLVLTLRADFFGHASSYRPFADALQDSMLILGPMNRKELEDAIEKPAHLLGVTIEGGLSERLLEAVGEEPGNLPLLEFALTQLWSRRRDWMLMHAAYEEIGGVKQALAAHAEAAFRELDPQEQQPVRRIFTQLVQPSRATEDTRRIATESELGPENWKLVVRLADARLVVTGRDEASEEETVEIVHEALIREWDRLRQWTNEDREFRQWQERLRGAMRQWEVSGRDDGALLRGGVLAEAKRWVGDRGGELAESERDYILTSIRMQEQERIAGERMRRRIISSLAIGLGLALVLAALAGWQWREAVTQKREADSQRQVAEEQRREAVAQRRTALSRQLAVQAISLSSQGLLDLALLLSQEALRVSETTEASDALLMALQYSPRLTTFLRGHAEGVSSMAFSPDGRVLTSRGDDGTVILWDPQSRQSIGDPLRGYGGSRVSSMAFSPDGRMLALGGDDGTVILWDSQSRQPIGDPLRGYGGSGVRSVAFSPDGRTLALGGDDGTVILWDLQKLQQRGTPLRFHGGSYGVSSMAFSPDGRMLASGGDDGTVILWDLNIESWKERACRIANRNLTHLEWTHYLEDEPPQKTCPKD